MGWPRSISSRYRGGASRLEIPFNPGVRNRDLPEIPFTGSIQSFSFKLIHAVTSIVLRNHFSVRITSEPEGHVVDCVITALSTLYILHFNIIQI